MKRNQAAAMRETELDRKRALIRSLIEQHGWATAPTAESRSAKREQSPLVDNIIPFPAPARRR